MMIKAGADINAYDAGGPLISAIKSLADKKAAFENVKILVKAGADVHVEDFDGNTALHCLLKEVIGRAIKRGLARMEKDLELVDMLIAEGAKKKKFNPALQTPLEYASWEFHEDCSNKLRRDKAIRRLAQHLGVRFVKV